MAKESWLIIAKYENKTGWHLAAWVETNEEAQKLTGRMQYWAGIEDLATVHANGLSLNLAQELLKRMARDG